MPMYNNFMCFNLKYATVFYTRFRLHILVHVTGHAAIDLPAVF